MTKRERVLSAVQHREPDKVPYFIQMTGQQQEKLAVYYKDPNFMDKLGNHLGLRWISPGGYEEVSLGRWRDGYGLIWDKTGIEKDIGELVNTVLPEPTLHGYTFPEVDDEGLRQDLDAFITSAPPDTCRLVSLGFAYYDRAWTMRGLENLMMDFLANPGFVDALLERILEINLQLIDLSMPLEGIDGFHLADDWGHQRGLTMGPHLWRRFIKPGVQEMFDRVKKYGKIVSLHSCGDITAILPDLIGMGLDIYQTVQPDIYDLPAIKRQYGQDLTFWGAISTQRLLPFGTPDEVRQVVKRTLEVMGKGGGYIAGPSHDIQHDTPVENMEALLEVLQGQ